MSPECLLDVSLETLVTLCTTQNTSGTRRTRRTRRYFCINGDIFVPWRHVQRLSYTRQFGSILMMSVVLRDSIAVTLDNHIQRSAHGQPLQPFPNLSHYQPSLYYDSLHQQGFRSSPSSMNIPGHKMPVTSNYYAQAQSFALHSSHTSTEKVHDGNTFREK